MLQTATKSQVSFPEVVRVGAINRAFGGVEGGVFGGVKHGQFENDFDWGQLYSWKGPKCGEVCRDPSRSNQCYPVNDVNPLSYGPPCGVVTRGSGCFRNAPTQTCALCTYPAQPYCCPYEDIPICGHWTGGPLESAAAPLVRLGETNPEYGGVQGGVFGGWKHGPYLHDFNWKALSTWHYPPQCSQVCRAPWLGNQCYPVKWSNGRYGPPCGVVTRVSGCFTNEPTQTCALCTYPAQPYCCPYHLLPLCRR